MLGILIFCFLLEEFCWVPIQSFVDDLATFDESSCIETVMDCIVGLAELLKFPFHQVDRVEDEFANARKKTTFGKKIIVLGVYYDLSNSAFFSIDATEEKKKK